MSESPWREYLSRSLKKLLPRVNQSMHSPALVPMRHKIREQMIFHPHVQMQPGVGQGEVHRDNHPSGTSGLCSLGRGLQARHLS